MDEARDVFLEYISAEAQTGLERERAATCAIALAKLDLVFRAACYDPEFEHADPEDVADLMAMLSVAPFDLLAPAALIELNPVFGDASFAVGGADTDIIAGDLLLDLQTSKQDRIQAENLDQLLGYVILARRARRGDRRCPLVRRAGLYYARFAHPMILETTVWTGHPLFRETERWFFKRARESATEEPPEADSGPAHLRATT